MLDDILDYTEQIRERPVWQPIPQPVRERFQKPLPQKPANLAHLHETFLREILPYSVGNAHPRFMGWVHGGGTPVGMLAEMLAAGLNANLGGRDQIPVEVERQVVRWMRELFGFPDTASGLFVTGTSMANLIAVLVARTHALGTSARREGIAAGGQALIAYTSARAHGSIARAMDLSGLGTDRLRLIPVNQFLNLTFASRGPVLGPLLEAYRRGRRAGLLDLLPWEDRFAQPLSTHRATLGLTPPRLYPISFAPDAYVSSAKAVRQDVQTQDGILGGNL